MVFIKLEEIMSTFKDYIKTAVQPMRPYIVGEPMKKVRGDKGVIPKAGGMIAVDPKNPIDMWYITPELFEATYKEVRKSTTVAAAAPEPKAKKQMDITDHKGAKANINDVVIFGNTDTFQLICKASSQAGGWMKSTKAMEIKGLGCLVQVTTQQGDNVAEALEFVPGVRILAINNDPLQGRKIVSIK